MIMSKTCKSFGLSITLILSAASLLATSLLATSAALAHPSLETRQAPAGTTYKAVLRMPHGCDGSPTIKVRAQIPEGVIAVKPMPKPGWRIETVKGAYAKTYPYFHGPISEGVREISWTGNLSDEHFDEFVFSGYLARDLAAGTIYFPVTQQCEKGEYRWVEIPVAGQDAHALKEPAPALVILAQAARPEDTKPVKAGSLTIEGAWSRATPGGAKVGGGFMKITNHGKEADRLIGGSVPQAGRFEIHEMAIADGVMRMRPLPKGLEIKPGETVELKPGGYHLMFMDLREGLKQGQTIKGTLRFEKAGSVDVEYRVGPLGGGGSAPAAGGHSHH
jgi:periplasmic copper chaperone A